MFANATIFKLHTKQSARGTAFVLNKDKIPYNWEGTMAQTTKSSSTNTDKNGDEKSNKSAKQPKTVLDKIIYAIRQQPGASSSKGVSRLAITKYLKAELDYDNANAIKTALKKGVDKGQLEQTGQSFRVKGDPVKQEAEGPKLEMEDIVTGKEDADEAQEGDSVTVKYVGKLDDGHQFDAASSFTFVLGAGDVIKGWDRGVKGMRVGGKRKLVVPSQLGYGKRGCAPDIPGNATLHFVVTLKKISRPKG